ncbi:MAG: ATP-binding protein [Lachnoclostridium sp.]|nr:ATP-binding protein [Lachnospira sp.]MCM1248520.1 ATP-binding protein [Lachnoclostridium sp.]MCM1535318.1 ATP-binding protein [Clostridium sp.]
MNNQPNLSSNIIEEWLFLAHQSQPYTPENGSLNSISEKSQNTMIAYHLMQFTNKMPGGFFIYRADGRQEILYANHAMLDIFNCETLLEFKEWTKNSFGGIVHPDDWDAIKSSIAKQQAAHQPNRDYAEEYRIIQKGGSIRWLDATGHFVRSVAGNIFYVFVKDVTEKRELERQERERYLYALKQNEGQLNDRIHKYNQALQVIHPEHLRRLETIEGLSIDYDSIFYANLDTNRIKAYRLSDPFSTLLSEEHPSHEFVGFDTDYINNWVHPDDRKLLVGVTQPDYIRTKLAHEKTFHINHRIINDGKIIYMQLRIVNVSSNDYASRIVLGYRNVDVEIVREMKQSQILQEALDEATLANNAKNLFLSNMSHDIRTPMNAIVGFTSLLKKHVGDTQRTSDYLNMISTASSQLLQLLNDVLEISRIESGKIQIENSECNLQDVISQIHSGILPQAEAKNIDLSLDFSALKHTTVCTDVHTLGQILSHIVDNAVKYAHTNGRVSVKVLELENEKEDFATYQFVVADNGIGIGKDFIPHMFEPFEREQNTTMSGIAGTGLGLTIAKDLTEMLNGSIDVHSIVGEGSTFTVTLPMQILEPSPIQEVWEPEEDPSVFSNPRRVLIVDDNEINLEIENEVLKDAGFLVDTAEDGSIAVEKVRQSTPGFYDLILMDIQMPIMDGYHATRAIRALSNPELANIPIVAVSANAFYEDKRAALESGMNAHLAKPLDTTLLYKLIHKLLDDTNDIKDMAE